jgi:hypothetical protein
VAFALSNLILVAIVAAATARVYRPHTPTAVTPSTEEADR